MQSELHHVVLSRWISSPPSTLAPARADQQAAVEPDETPPTPSPTPPSTLPPPSPPIPTTYGPLPSPHRHPRRYGRGMPERRSLHPRVNLTRRRRGSTSRTRSREVEDAAPRTSLVDSAVYRDGRRSCSPSTLPATLEALRERRDGMAWIGLYRPGVSELQSLADEFSLHELAVEDAVNAHQRPKLERYGETLFLVLRAARYLDDVEEVEFGELHLFVGPDFVITVRHSESPDLSIVRRRLEDDPELLAKGTDAVLYAILDAVVDGYLPVVAGIENDVDEIETQVFDGDPAVSRRIYELSREVVDFQRAAHPLLDMLDSLARASTTTVSTRNCAARCATSPTT